MQLLVLVSQTVPALVHSAVGLAHVAADVVVRAAGNPPEDKDVKAGWTAFAIFLLLLLAVALLGWSLNRHLHTVQANRVAGVFGPDGVPADEDSGPAQPPTPPGPSGSAT